MSEHRDRRSVHSGSPFTGWRNVSDEVLPLTLSGGADHDTGRAMIPPGSNTGRPITYPDMPAFRRNLGPGGGLTNRARNQSTPGTGRPNRPSNFGPSNFALAGEGGGVGLQTRAATFDIISPTESHNTLLRTLNSLASGTGTGLELRDRQSLRSSQNLARKAHLALSASARDFYSVESHAAAKKLQEQGFPIDRSNRGDFYIWLIYLDEYYSRLWPAPNVRINCNWHDCLLCKSPQDHVRSRAADLGAFREIYYQACPTTEGLMKDEIVRPRETA